MRFRFDPAPDSTPPPGGPHEGGEALLSPDQRLEFLRLLHDGVGHRTACVRLSIDYAAFRRTVARSAGFRKAVKLLERLRAENLFTVLYTAALDGDMEAAKFLLARQDRLLGRRPQRPELN